VHNRVPLEKATAKKLREALFKPQPHDCGIRWANDINKRALAFRTPLFDVYSELKIRPKYYEPLWLIFHHSLPCKARLHHRGHPGVLEPFCPHHPIPTIIPESISHVIFCQTVRPIWSWLFFVLSKINAPDKTLLSDDHLYAATDENLMNLLLTSWAGRGNDMWKELMTVGVFCIVRERNRLSIDNICQDTVEGVTRHRNNIRKQIAYRFRGIVAERSRSLANKVDRIIDSKTHKKFMKLVSEFQGSYGGNSFLGVTTVTQVPVSFEYAPKQVFYLLRPKYFPSENRFSTPNLGRTRSSTAATNASFSSPPVVNSTIPPIIRIVRWGQHPPNSRIGRYTNTNSNPTTRITRSNSNPNNSLNNSTNTSQFEIRLPIIPDADPG